MIRVRQLGTAAGMITAIAICAACSAQDGASPVPPPAPAAPSAATLDPEADKILTRLEKRRVRDIRAKVTWSIQNVFDQPGDAVIKRGELLYKDDQPSPKFLIKLDEKILDGRPDRMNEQYLFDGQWYVELKGEAGGGGNVHREEVQKSGDRRNLFKLGEGPFPVPFGQSKADILKEFSVERLPPRDGDPPDTDVLRLTSRPGSNSIERYKYVDFWVVRDEKDLSGLPIQVKAAKKDGAGQVNSIITVKFDKVRLDDGVSSALFRIETPSGFNETIERLDAPPTGGSTANGRGDGK